MLAAAGEVDLRERWLRLTVTTDMRVVCWGEEASYAPVLGTTTGDPACSSTQICSARPRVIPLLVGGGSITNALSVACGTNFACAVLTDGTVRCWGESDGGQLGADPGAMIGAVEPRIMGNALPPTSMLALGTDHACALSMAGDVTCWGVDTAGELGRGTVGGSSAPAHATVLEVHMPSGVQAIAATGATTCIAISGTPISVGCVGANGWGVLGVDPMTTPSSTTLSIVGGASVDPGHALLFADDETLCVIDDVRRVSCWGNNDAGALGRRDLSGSSPTPQGLAGAAGMLDFDTLFTGGGGLTRCASGTNGTYCWGDNAHGTLNQSTASMAYTSVPMLAPELANVRAGACGGGFCCATLADQSLVCWGANDVGQLGRGTVGADDFHPGAVCAP